MKEMLFVISFITSFSLFGQQEKWQASIYAKFGTTLESIRPFPGFINETIISPERLYTHVTLSSNVSYGMTLRVLLGRSAHFETGVFKENRSYRLKFEQSNIVSNGQIRFINYAIPFILIYKVRLGSSIYGIIGSGVHLQMYPTSVEQITPDRQVISLLARNGYLNYAWNVQTGAEYEHKKLGVFSLEFEINRGFRPIGSLFSVSTNDKSIQSERNLKGHLQGISLKWYLPLSEN